MKKVIASISMVAIVALLFSCGSKDNSKYPGYEEVESGLFVKYLTKNEAGREVLLGEIVSMSMVYTINNDSVLLDTRTNNIPVKVRADSGAFNGDIMGAFLGMHVGDSASIIVDADTFFMKTAGAPSSPAFIDSADALYFTIKILETQSEEELQQAEQARGAAKIAEENEILQKYLSENGITQAPTESGLIFISKQAGNGKKAEAGKKVSVAYAGRVINGTYFDTSYEEIAKEQGLYTEGRTYQPYTFTLGAGEVIRGWDEGIAMMSVGEKATLIIPSSLAYGANPRPGVIQPFNTLIFDVELVEVAD